MTPLSHLNRNDLETLVEDLLGAMHHIKALDKTLEYDYHGKRSLNRNGEPPPPGRRWERPYNLAVAAIKNVNDVLSGEKTGVNP